MNWLLPAQTLLDLISSAPTPAQAWSVAADTRSLRVSVLSVAQARAAIMREPDPGDRARLEADLNAFLYGIEADSGMAPLALADTHASTWAALMHEPALAGVPQIDRQVYATALHEGMTVVEERRTATAALQTLGVRIHLL